MQCQIRKPTKNHALDVAKNMWKHIPQLMQQHYTLQKGQYYVTTYKKHFVINTVCT